MRRAGRPAITERRDVLAHRVAGFSRPALQRLPSHFPLAEVTLSRDVCWNRTEDQSLWLAPKRSDYGIDYGHSGTGSRTLARLLDTLLDDISSPRCRRRRP
ncbi:hypothetical protein [Streptomyces sp. 62]|uniref:hypothetical protein n=1 Tax=unclassified Streptomyces TaxID=2593676 RepID=UPI000E3A744C